MNIDAIIVFGYLVVTLIYGLYVGRGVKDIKDYALGGRNFTTPVLAATIFATQASSSGFYIDLTKSYEDGMYNLLATSGQVIGLLFTAYFIAPRMKEFFGKLTVSEMMEDLYGKNARIISSVPLFLKSAGFVAIQMKVLSSMLEYFSGLDSFYAIILTSIVVILYSAFGGIKAVTFTDFIQFATFGVAIPMIFANVFLSIDFHNNIPKQTDLFNHIFTFEESKLNIYMMLFIYLLLPGLSGTMTQRMLMAKDAKQIKESITVAATLLIAIYVLSNFIGFFIHVDNPNLLPKEVLPYLIDNYTYTGIKGILIIGIIAMAMSTADSNLNVGSISFSHDFCKPLGLVSDKNELMLSKIFTLICGALGIILALKFQDLISLILFVGGFYLSMVSVPLLLALFGFRSTQKAVLIGMAFGVITVIFWESGMKYLGFENPISSFLPGMFAHMIGLFGAHYLLGEKGGWGQGPGSGPFNSPPKDFWGKNDSTSKKKEQNLANFFDIFTSKEKFFHFLSKNLPQTRYFYNSLAFLNCCIYFLVLVYIDNLRDKFLLMFVGVLFCSFALLMRNLIKDRDGHILLPAYLLGILYCYPFLSTYILLETNFALYSVVLTCISIIIIQILMTAEFALITNLLGVMIASVFFVKSHNLPEFVAIISQQYKLIFFIVASFLMTKMLIFRNNWNYIIGLIHSNKTLEDDKHQLNSRLLASEENIKRLYNLKSEILNNFSHEVRTPLTTMGNFLELVHISIEKSSKALPNFLDAKKNFESLKKYILRLSDLSEYQKGNMIYEMGEFNLTDLLENISLSYSSKIKVNLEIDEIFKYKKLHLDALKIKQIIEEIIDNSITHARSDFIDIKIRYKQDQNLIKFSFRDYAFNNICILKNSDLDKIFNEFEITGGGTQGYKGLGLAFVREVVKSHKGSMSAQIHTNNLAGFEIAINLPISFEHKEYSSSELKPKIKDLTKKLKVLLVDDDEIILRSTAMILESLGHEVYLAVCGKEAIDFVMAKNLEIDVILLDIMMPDMTGIEVLAVIWDELKERGVKTVMQSGAGIIHEYSDIIKKYEGISYCTKPYTKNQLMTAIYE